MRKNKKRKTAPFFLTILLVFVIVGAFVIKGINFSQLFPSHTVVNPKAEESPEDIFRALIGQSGISLNGLNFRERDILATTSFGTTVLFSRSSDIKLQVASLQLIISRSKIDGRVPKKIDLRFEKPIVVY